MKDIGNKPETSQTHYLNTLTSRITSRLNW